MIRKHCVEPKSKQLVLHGQILDRIYNQKKKSHHKSNRNNDNLNKKFEQRISNFAQTGIGIMQKSIWFARSTLISTLIAIQTKFTTNQRQQDNKL
ncbi:unnamed protein product [Paramecium sonneborni]|uniref:Uncharacterized protein n=1 Tax=Paramecium sonneborni TaxID=65129 RepID=A0A8S1PZG6_9CILI|nr:unnamed protein product [Paramecium sonneborni]